MASVFKLFFSLLFFNGNLAFSANVEEPFVPAYAADQELITTQTIGYEGQQFAAIGEWHIIRDQTQTKELEKRQATESFERAQNLFEKGLINEGQFRQAEFKLKQAEAALRVSQAEMEVSKSTGLRYKSMILDRGNSEVDMRLQVAEALKTVHKNTQVIYESQLVGAEGAIRFWTFWVEAGRKLFEKRIITKPELDQRILRHQMALERLSGIQLKLRTVSAALVGVEKTIEALQ